jgi:hypothetical protein
MSDVVTRQQYWGNFQPKQAEAAGTDVMPHGAPIGKSKVPQVIKKTGSGPTETPTTMPDGASAAPGGTQPAKNPQAAPINPRVNVDGKEAPAPKKEKAAGFFALTSMQRYPLDSFSEVEKAAEYFEQWSGHFEPVHRREYCLNLVKRAEALGVPTSSKIRKYGSAERAPAPEVAIGIDARRGVVTNDIHAAALGKIAGSWHAIPPELLAETLSEFDKIAGIDHLYDEQIPDPYWTVFGEKTAEDDAATHIIGNELVSNKQLDLLSKSSCDGLYKLFGEDFVKEFKKDPTGIFSSLPMDQKKILARMANDIHSP